MQVDELTDEELDRMLQDRKKKKQREDAAKRKAYEAAREELVIKQVNNALIAQDALREHKSNVFNELVEFATKMNEYGDIKGNSKGGFAIRSADDTHKVTYSQQVIKGFDERADLAEKKLVEFLESFIKSRNKKAYKLVMSLLERTTNGEFDVNMINRLYKMEGDFDQPLWVEAIGLFKEAYTEQKTVQYVNFYKRDEHGKWANITLNFSAINI